MRHAKTNFTPVAWLSIPYGYTMTKTGLIFKPGFQFFSLKIQIILLFISLEIDCFHSQWTANICTAGLNRWAGYTTVYVWCFHKTKLILMFTMQTYKELNT